MAQLINKSAIIVEIERLKSIQLSIFSKGETEESCYNALFYISVYNEVLSFLNTLEVKEVDLDLGSPDGDMGVKTVWDGDKIVSSKTQKGE